MVAQVFCLTSSGGLPLFVRKKGDGEPLSYSYIASLNGVHMFAKSQGVQLEDTISDESVVCWKEFHNRLILIGMSSNSTSFAVKEFLDSVFDAMVLCVGIDELINVKNPERLKRELRITYKLIDKLLENLDSSEKMQPKLGNGNLKVSSGSLNDFVETILCQENQTYLNCLENFAEAIDSHFGWLSVHGRIAAATSSWWALDPREKKLLSTLAALLDETAVSSDVPVFLPRRSPSVPFRLVTVHLLTGVEVSVLCGPEPPGPEIERIALQTWRPMVETLTLTEKSRPSNLSVGSQGMDGNILGFMLVDTADGKFVLSRILPKRESSSSSSSSSSSASSSGTHRLNVLKTFYKQSARVFLTSEGCEDEVAEEEEEKKKKKKNGNDNPPLETYWCSEYHKCHGFRQGSNLICILYGAGVSSHTMRIITRQCLKMVLSEKQFCW